MASMEAASEEDRTAAIVLHASVQVRVALCVQETALPPFAIRAEC